MCLPFVVILVAPKCKNINVFQVPEVPKEVPKKKVHPPQKPEAIPVKGTSNPERWDRAGI